MNQVKATLQTEPAWMQRSSVGAHHARRGPRLAHRQPAWKEAPSYVGGQNKETTLSLIEALNARDLGLWSRHLSEDYAAEHPGVSVLLDKTRSIAYHQRFVTAFPDIRFEVLFVLAEGDSVLVQWTASGTHAERLTTVTGRLSP
jgi:hypothetical protein